jgi:hypothetical protein
MEILDYKDAMPGEKHLGEFSIYSKNWGVTFKRWKVRRTAKGHLYVSGPVFGVDQTDGSKKFYPYIEFSNKKAFEDKVMELLQPFIQPQF